MLVEYCKTGKTYIADSELMKRRAKSFKVDTQGLQIGNFYNIRYKMPNKILQAVAV